MNENKAAAKESGNNFNLKVLIKKEKFGLVCAIIVLIIFFGIMNPKFFTGTNITNILRQMSPMAIGAAGVSLALLLGGIDLSIGSIIGVASVFGATWIKFFYEIMGGWGIILGAVLCLILCFFCGAGQGWIIAKYGIPAFIVTLGGQTFFRGAVFVYTQGMPIAGLPEPFLKIATGAVGKHAFNSDFPGIPYLAIIALLIYLILHFMLTRTKLGRYLYAIGGNEDAAILSGIKVKRFKILAHALASCLGGIAGLVLTARVVTGQPIQGEGMELDFIAATVIGGTSFRGGEGSMGGTILGVLVISLIRNGLNLLKVSSFIQMMVIGAMIILAVIIDTLQKGRDRLK